MKEGRPKGHAVSAETRAKIGRAMAAKWRDPSYRAVNLPHLLKIQPSGTKASHAVKFHPPARGTPEYRAYRKIFDILGPEVAREQFKSAETDLAGQP